jgi:hypothetical protein
LHTRKCIIALGNEVLNIFSYYIVIFISRASYSDSCSKGLSTNWCLFNNDRIHQLHASWEEQWWENLDSSPLLIVSWRIKVPCLYIGAPLDLFIKASLAEACVQSSLELTYPRKMCFQYLKSYKHNFFKILP